MMLEHIIFMMAVMLDPQKKNKQTGESAVSADVTTTVSAMTLVSGEGCQKLGCPRALGESDGIRT